MFILCVMSLRIIVNKYDISKKECRVWIEKGN